MKSGQFPTNQVWLLSRVSLSHMMQTAEDYLCPKSPHVHNLIINKDHVSWRFLNLTIACAERSSGNSFSLLSSSPLGVRFLAVSFQLKIIHVWRVLTFVIWSSTTTMSIRLKFTIWRWLLQTEVHGSSNMLLLALCVNEPASWPSDVCFHPSCDRHIINRVRVSAPKHSCFFLHMASIRYSTQT